MSRFETARIRDYYDRNTSAFVALGEGGGAIHRAVWGPGVGTREQAFHYVEDQIAAHLRELAPPMEAGSSGPTPHVVDLGCGVAASLAYLATRRPIRGTGITLSPVQAQAGRERIRLAGLSDRVECVEGDFAELPGSLERADAAYAIESFVHGPDPSAFLSEAYRLLRPGGLLIICDDFKRPTTNPSAARTLDRFARGWHINTLLTSEELLSLAESTGFQHVSTTDLTPWLELRRPRDRAIDVGVALFGWLPLDNTRVGHLIGGSALQRGLARGWIKYELAVFRRT